MNAKKNNLILVVLLILVPLGIGSCVFSDIVSLPQRSTQSAVELSQTIAAQEASFGTAEANAQTTFTAQEFAMGTTVAGAQMTSTAQESLLQNAADAFSTATNEASMNSTQVTGLMNVSATQYTQIEDYNYSIRCFDRPNSIDFTNNSTVSASLKSWLEKTSEEISIADWEELWDGTETAIHRLSGEYYYVYLVYFDEPENYFYASVFDVYMQCFLFP